MGWALPPEASQPALMPSFRCLSMPSSFLTRPFSFSIMDKQANDTTEQETKQYQPTALPPVSRSSIVVVQPRESSRSDSSCLTHLLLPWVVLLLISSSSPFPSTPPPLPDHCCRFTLASVSRSVALFLTSLIWSWALAGAGHYAILSSVS